MERGGDPRGAWVWIAIGCGGLALSLLCILPPALWLGLSDEPDVAGSPSVSPPSPQVAPPPVAPVPPIAPAPFPSMPPPPSPSLPPPPTTGTTSARRVSAIVEQVSGVPGLRHGSTCLFDVTRVDRDDGTFWCNAQVSCGGQLLYGGVDAGFFECTLYEQPERHVVGDDPDTTSADRDAAMHLDTLRSQLTVRDDASGRLGAFSVRARVTSIR